MKINIYYGGRGLLDDPTLYVINKFQEVLEELRVTVERFNIYEQKNAIATLPQTFKDADGIILATTVEWLGMGGYMVQFLDACWLYGDKEKISSLYMQPIVMSTTYGEKEALLSLTSAWEMLGGLPCGGLSGYVDDLVSFELNKEYTGIIEKKTENMYRTISQRTKGLPSSNQAVTRTVTRTQPLELTPQESEQLSKYVSDDSYVKKQKEDLADLTNMYRDKLGDLNLINDEEYVIDFESHFIPPKDAKASFVFMIEGKKKHLVMEVDDVDFSCYYGQLEQADQYIKVTPSVLESIINGQMTFQRAFMTGEMSAKGDFKVLRLLDRIFNFES